MGCTIIQLFYFKNSLLWADRQSGCFLPQQCWRHLMTARGASLKPEVWMCRPHSATQNTLAQCCEKPARHSGLAQLYPNADPRTNPNPSCHWKGWVRGRLGLCTIPQFPQECFQPADSGNEPWTTRGINVRGETERLLEIFYIGQWRKTAHFNTLGMLPNVKALVSPKKEICSKL